MKDKIVAKARQKMLIVAKFLDEISQGKIKPNHITLLSLLGHIPVAIALIAGEPILAAALLAVFAGMDSLDGALAKVQKTSSLTGMYYDAVSDRAKEIIVFAALGVYLSSLHSYDYTIHSRDYTWLIAAALGTSILVSYTKAKGEMAISDSSGGSTDAQKINRIFSSGFSSYEVRVVLLIIGLLFAILPQILVLLLIMNTYTIIIRVKNVSDALEEKNNQEKSKK
jgi:CDP-diacylglycerol--glycerol-3-phosphate 3-phosphatidyltransferase